MKTYKFLTVALVLSILCGCSTNDVKEQINLTIFQRSGAYHDSVNIDDEFEEWSNYLEDNYNMRMIFQAIVLSNLYFAIYS